MKVSVLMPSRDRVELARASLQSLGSVEALIWVDDDDPQLADYLKLDAKVLVRPRVGYPRFHEMVNRLAQDATGDWLLLWNDDALMHTSDWQTKLPQADKPQVLNIFNSNPEVNLFPLISRSMYESMGHYSLSPHCDSWVQDIGNALDIHTFIQGVDVAHLRDTIHDETKNHSQSSYATTSPLHSSEAIQQAMQLDIEKLKEFL